MLSLRHVTILKYLHGPPSSLSFESHREVNSFSRFLGLEPLASERGVASVGDPVNRGERLGDSAVTSNALSWPFFLFGATIKGKKIANPVLISWDHLHFTKHSDGKQCL